MVTPPAHGSLTLNADGSFTYTPDSGYGGSDSFDFQAADPSGNYATATATISYTVVAPPSATIFWPPSGGTYAQGQFIATSFSCAEGDSGPGLATCMDSNGATGPTGQLDTSAPGNHTYTVIATSENGLVSQVSIAYTVEAAVPAPVPPPPILKRKRYRVLVAYRRFGGIGGDSVHLVVAQNGNARLATRSGTRRASLNRKIQARLT